MGHGVRDYFCREMKRVEGIEWFWGLDKILGGLTGAYRFAAITLSIVLVIAHKRTPWIVASHRFVEVSLGIAVALLMAEVWKCRARGGMNTALHYQSM